MAWCYEVSQKRNAISKWPFALLVVGLIAGILWAGFYLSPYYDQSKWPLGKGERTATEAPEISLYENGACKVKPTNITQPSNPKFIELFPGTLVYSVFYDNTREEKPYFRIMVVSETFRPAFLYCHSRCDTKITELARYYLPKEHKKRSHAAFIASCSAPKGIGSNPGFLEISAAEFEGKKHKTIRIVVSSTDTQKHFQNLTICVPPIYKGDGPTDYNVAEFIELNKLLGANHFVFYDLEISSKVGEVLKHYKNKGDVTLLSWDMPSYLRDFYSIHYHGQLLSLQDCLYRTRGRTKFVAFHDIDEFIVPRKQITIPEMLNAIYDDKICGYRIRSVVFPKQIVDPEGKNSKLLSQRHFKRTVGYIDKRSKCVVNPHKVFSMDIHNIGRASDPGYKQEWIITQASVYHYRQCIRYEDLVGFCQEVKTEYRLKRYKKILEERVNKVLSGLGM